MPSNLFGPGRETRTASDIRRDQDAAKAEDRKSAAHQAGRGRRRV